MPSHATKNDRTSTLRSHTVTTATTARRAHLTIADVCAELGIACSTFYDWLSAKSDDTRPSPDARTTSVTHA
jgi:transposase-like protein